MRFSFSLIAAALLFVAGCSTTVSRNDTVSDIEMAPVPAQSAAVSRNDGPRILAMGDSAMAWHNFSGRSIPDTVARELNEDVSNNAIGGARVIYKLPISGAAGMKIANQYRKGDWDWILVNGGGNDLWLGCGCMACENKMNRMISADGRKGAIPHMLDSLRKTGAQVVYVGYLRSPGAWSPIEHCRDEGDELEARVSRLADILPDVHFVSVADMVPHGDRSYHGVDMIHPSVKASTEIGQRVATLIKQVESAPTNSE